MAYCPVACIASPVSYFAGSPIENVINLFPDVRSETEELPIDAVESRLQKVPLSRIFTVEQLQELQSDQTSHNKPYQMFVNHANNAKLTWWTSVLSVDITHQCIQIKQPENMNAGNLNTFIKCSILNKTGVLRVQYALLMLTINWLDSMPSDSEAHKWTWTHISTHLHHKLLVDVFLGYVWLKVGRL